MRKEAESRSDFIHTALLVQTNRIEQKWGAPPQIINTIKTKPVPDFLYVKKKNANNCVKISNAIKSI